LSKAVSGGAGSIGHRAWGIGHRAWSLSIAECGHSHFGLRDTDFGLGKNLLLEKDRFFRMYGYLHKTYTSFYLLTYILILIIVWLDII